jgi:integrase
MTVLYLTAMRKKDLLKLVRPDLREEGLYVQQSKTGVKQLKEWTLELRQAINAALALPSAHPTMHVFHNSSGGPIGESSLNNDWREAWALAIKAVPTLERFTIHDLKAKSISDFQGDKQAFSGHKTERQVATYDRKIKQTPTLKMKQKGDES